MPELLFADQTMVTYSHPKGLERDNPESPNCNMEFDVLMSALTNVPVPVARWLNGNANCEIAKNAGCKYKEEAVSLFFANTPDTERFLTIQHIKIHNLRFKKDKDGEIHLKFDALVPVDKSTCDTILLRRHTQFCINCEQTQSDLEFMAAQDAAENGSDDADDEVSAQFNLELDANLKKIGQQLGEATGDASEEEMESDPDADESGDKPTKAKKKRGK